MTRPSLVEIVTSLDRDEDVHLARILFLLRAFSRDDGPALHGITKLVKLDFLLRYPSYFEKALIARDVSMKNLPVEDYERLTVEARMVRYRFGPWDHRYRRFLNILAGKGLVSLRTDGRTIQIDLTDRGHGISEALANRSEFGKIAQRAALLRRHLDIGATRLMEFIYEQFPEIATLEYDEGITMEAASNEDIA